MEKYAVLLGYYTKQRAIVEKLAQELQKTDLSSYSHRYVFALKTQQFYTAIEDFLKQIAKNFENQIQDLSFFHKELLVRLRTEIPSIRPAVLSTESFVFLDKIRSFRHFIRHAYDCELKEEELRKIQRNISVCYGRLVQDFEEFQKFVELLATPGS